MAEARSWKSQPKAGPPLAEKIRRTRSKIAVSRQVGIQKSDIYAVVEISGTQAIVRVGEEYGIDRVDTEEGKTFEADILLLNRDGKIKIGTPKVSGAKVVFKVLEHGKGKKLEVRKFRAKSRYRRKLGFRPSISRVRVEKIVG